MVLIITIDIISVSKFLFFGQKLFKKGFISIEIDAVTEVSIMGIFLYHYAKFYQIKVSIMGVGVMGVSAMEG